MIKLFDKAPSLAPWSPPAPCDSIAPRELVKASNPGRVSATRLQLTRLAKGLCQNCSRMYLPRLASRRFVF